MTGSSGRDSALRLLEEIGGRFRDEDGDLVPGASLLLVRALAAADIDMNDESLGVAAEFLSLPLESLRNVARFHDSLVEGPAETAGATLTLCLGTSCSLHGAVGFHKELKAHYGIDGGGWTLREVFCLGQCESGPSMMLGREIYCARAQAVVADERRWRSTDEGQVHVDDDSVPVRD